MFWYYFSLQVDDLQKAFSKNELSIPFEFPPVRGWGGGGILVSVFIEASRNLKSRFRYIRDAKNFIIIGACTKSTDVLYKALKNYLSRDTIPLRPVAPTHGSMIVCICFWYLVPEAAGCPLYGEGGVHQPNVVALIVKNVYKNVQKNLKFDGILDF